MAIVYSVMTPGGKAHRYSQVWRQVLDDKTGDEIDFDLVAYGLSPKIAQEIVDGANKLPVCTQALQDILDMIGPIDLGNCDEQVAIERAKARALEALNHQ